MLIYNTHTYLITYNYAMLDIYSGYFWQPYFFLWISAQPLILSIIPSFLSASLTALVSWDQLIIGSILIYLAGLTLCE